MTEKEITAMRAVLHLAVDNPRFGAGGMYIEDIHDYKNCAKISFAEAVDIVIDMLYGSESETEVKQ